MAPDKNNKYQSDIMREVSVLEERLNNMKEQLDTHVEDDAKVHDGMTTKLDDLKRLVYIGFGIVIALESLTKFIK